jgi:UDP-N-acetylglucosamine:(glucosyl)LPS alpha-1,2-N-acetylglucosaminyltransferase
MKIIDYLLTNIVDRLIFVSEATKNSIFFNSHLMDSAKIKSSVIINGFKIIQDYKKSDRIQKNYGIISRFDCNKGQDILLQTISQLDSKIFKNVNFLLIGRNLNNNRMNFKKFIEENKISIQIVENYEKSIGKLLSDIDLLITNTQDFEGFGYIAIEALSLGIPVISTKVGATSEVLKNTAAKLVNPGDINELKNKLYSRI